MALWTHFRLRQNCSLMKCVRKVFFLFETAFWNPGLACCQPRNMVLELLVLLPLPPICWDYRCAATKPILWVGDQTLGFVRARQAHYKPSLTVVKYLCTLLTDQISVATSKK